MSASQKLRRSILFFPALAPERWEEAMASPADMVVFDLEDGTIATRKQEARETILPRYAERRSGRHPQRLLRINSPRAAEGLRDLLALLEQEAAPDALILPKVDTDEEVRWAADLLAPRHPGIELVALIETPRGLRNAAAIAQATRGRPGPQVVALFLGSADLSADLGSDMSWDALAHARGTVVAAAREAGIDAIDGVFFDPHDLPGLHEEARRIAAMGFTGKASYDAAQIALIHAAFAPSATQVGWARRVVATAAADPLGTARLDGRMINESIVRAARRMLALAERDGIDSSG